MTVMRPPTRQIRPRLPRGLVIPAHPLALDADRRLDERRQRALTRYYSPPAPAGSRSACTPPSSRSATRVGLFEPVLALAAETRPRRWPTRREPLVRIAGVCGPTAAGVGRSRHCARDLGYHAGLLSLAALRGEPRRRSCSPTAAPSPR